MQQIVRSKCLGVGFVQVAKHIIRSRLTWGLVLHALSSDAPNGAFDTIVTTSD